MITMKKYILFIVTFLVSNNAFSDIGLLKKNMMSVIKSGNKPALIIVDIQNSFYFHLMKHQDTINNIDDILMYSSNNNVDIINITIPDSDPSGNISLLEYLYEIKHKSFFKINQSAFVEPSGNDSQLMLLQEQLKLKNTEQGSEIIKTSLDSYLKENNISDLFVTGCFEGKCIKDTVTGALEHGYNVHIDSDLLIPFKTQVTDWSEVKVKFKRKLKITSGKKSGNSSKCSIM